MSYASELRGFYSANPQFDIDAVDLISSPTADERLLTAAGGDLKAALRAHQRLSRLGVSGQASLNLLDRGLRSAHDIAELTEAEFVSSHADLFEGGPVQAAAAHRQAEAVKSRAIHLWANVHGLTTAKAARGLPSRTAHESLATFFSDQPDYAELFGDPSYCTCEQCKSMFGPAAYFVDLMRIVDRYVTRANAGSLPEAFTLEKRRPDLFDLELSCSNTNDPVPTLQIVNRLLGKLVCEELQVADALRAVAGRPYPTLAPYNDPLQDIRLHLDKLGTPLAGLWDGLRRPAVLAKVTAATADTLTLELPDGAALAPGAVARAGGAARVVTAWNPSTRTATLDAAWTPPVVGTGCTFAPDDYFVAREALGLSREQADVVAQARPAPEALRAAYGLTDQQPLSDLEDETLFRRQTTLTRPELDVALLQNMGAADLDAGLAHQLFINRPLPTPDYVHTASEEDGRQVIVGVTDQTLDRFNRFHRLSRWAGLAPADLDRLLAAAGADDIRPHVLLDLAAAVEIAAALEAPLGAVAALWSDLSTLTTGASAPGSSPFDRIFNRPDLRKGAAPYHPLYTKNPLYRDTPATLVVGGAETPSAGFGRARVMAALGFDDDALNAALRQLAADGDTVSLDVGVLTRLYRASLLGRALGLRPHVLGVLLELLGTSVKDDLSPALVQRILVVGRALAAARLTPAQARDLIGPAIPAGQKPALTYGAMKAAWALLRPALLEPLAFYSMALSATESQAAFDALLAHPGLVTDVTGAYAEVLGIDGPVAIVPAPVTPAQLAFLGQAPTHFDTLQIAAVVEALERIYTGQATGLVAQLATPLGATADGLAAAIDFSDALRQGARPWLPVLLVPVPEYAAGALRSPGWQAILDTLAPLARLLTGCAELGVSGSELAAYAHNPAPFGLTAAAPLDLDALLAILGYKAVLAAFDCEPEALWTVLDTPGDSRCSDGEKSARLAALTGWPRDQICAAAARTAGGPGYDTIAGLLRLKTVFDLLGATGADMRFVSPLADLADQTADDDAGWRRWCDAAVDVAGLTASRFPADGWPAISGSLAARLNESRRNALEATVIWRLGRKFPDIRDSRALYAFLLLDVEIGGCATTSPVIEGLAALQLYLQRCRLNMETGVDKLPIPAVWWEWMMNYRVWEANRKIFLYPENYLVPSVRKTKSSLFRALEDALLQAKVDDAAVARAYRDYLTGFDGIATLTYVDSYRCRRPEDEAANTETFYLFARTQAEPYVYYYAMKGADGAWGEWRKIDAAINSDTITPVYAFGRLMVFWVELKQTADPKFKAEGGIPVSTNSTTHTASIYFSFPDVNGAWTAPQSVGGAQTVYLAPSKTPFGDVEGALFDMSSLFWRKVNLLHVRPEKLVDANTPGERVVVLYGPFLDNDISLSPLKEQPAKPDASLQAVEPQRYAFELALFDTSVEINQALASRVRGNLALREARTFNIDLNPDCLVRSAEFLVLVENLSAGTPPALEPQLDLAVADLRVTDTRNPLRSNYAGDVTQRLGQSKAARRLPEDAFVAPGIDLVASGQVLKDLVGNGIVSSSTHKVQTFTRNTNLSFLFPGERDSHARELKIAVVRDELLRRMQADAAILADSFVVPAVDAAGSAQVLGQLQNAGLVSEDGDVDPRFDSKVPLGFLFVDDPHAALLRGEVRRVMLDALAAPLLLSSVARDAARVFMVKNQPAWFIFNNGNESFLVTPETETAPLLDLGLRVRDSASPQRVYLTSFRTSLINPAYSDQVFRDLLGNHIIDDDGYVVSFSTRTNLSFLFTGISPPSLRTAMVSQVRAILLGLPTLTALSYFQELPTRRIVETSFVSELVSATEAAAAFAALTNHGVVLDGVISAAYGSDTDLSYLFPDSVPDLRKRQIEDVRATLGRFYAATWQITVHDLKYRFQRLSTAAAPRLMAAFLEGGVEKLLALPSQQAPVTPVQPFSQYRPDGERVTAPEFLDGGQVDFDGPYGLYYWELFLFAPQLVAAMLSAGQRFEAAMRWSQHIFDPTQRPPAPLRPVSFITRDIGEGDAADAFAALEGKAIITPEGTVASGFGSGTDLDFLFPEIDDPPVRELMIGEVRAILLNARLSAPASHFWQFAPFRTHTLETLIDTVTDKAQIAVYNNAPFDPFAIARLRIGAFEKAIFQQYVDNLILWGDSLFARPTRESLTAAQLAYMYAAELLGPKPVADGACKTQGPTTFAAIRRRYSEDIPQFLIRLENLLPKQLDCPTAAVRDGAINEVEAVFCIPENDQLLGLWDRVEDRLYKLRHCLDLEGRPLQLALFEPPINPLLLARAAAAGGETGVVVANASGLSAPIYRFDTLIQQARSLAMTVGMLGSALASALQQRDYEKLQQLRASQEVALLSLQTESRKRDIEQIRQSITGGNASLVAANKRKIFYTDLADEFISPAEVIALLATDIGVRFKILGATLQTASSIAYNVPQVGSPFALTYGGIQLGNSLASAANNANTVATVSDYVALTATTLGGYQRRAQDWRFQAAQADSDILLYTAQIGEATQRLAAAEQELRINQLSIEQSKANAAFLLSKFDSRDLYVWTSSRLTTLYYQTYQLALAAALAAQSAYRFQLGRDADFINLQYWDPAHNGLLAGETLTLSLDQMEQSYYRLNSRRAEIVKSISLLDLAPAELLRLKTTGECLIRLDEATFDFDFPGYFNRRIATMGASVVFSTEYQPEAHLTLIQTRNDTLVRPDPAGLKWLLKPEGDAPPSVRRNLLPNQSIPVSTSSFDGMGVFEVSVNYDPRYFPFEGTGAVSEWRLEMPKATNRFDFESIFDVILTLRYTALDGGQPFRDTVQGELAGAKWLGGTYVDAKSAENDAWTAFMADHANPARQTLKLPLRRAQLPPNLSDISVTRLTLVLMTDVELPTQSQFLMVTPPGAEEAVPLPLARDWGDVSFVDGVSAWQGDWTIAVDLTAVKADPRLKNLLGGDGFLDPARFADLELVFGLKAAAFPVRTSQPRHREPA